MKRLGAGAAPGTRVPPATRNPNPNPNNRRRRPSWRGVGHLAPARSHEVEVDVVLVGSGIISLFIAHDILEKTDLSVAVVERADGLCAGATGAGQGYLWQLHRDPMNADAWSMALQGRARWRELAAADASFTVDQCGSLLLATTPEEGVELEARVAAVNDALPIEDRATFLPDRESVVKEEPSLSDSVADIFAGAMLPSDGQIDGQATTRAMFRKCERSPRFQSYFGSTVEHLIVHGGAAKGVVCADPTDRANGSKTILADAVCVCAGAWSSTLLSSWLDGDDGDRWRDAIVPRRGHLLKLEVGQRRGRQRLLNHGIMESSYSKHYISLRDNHCVVNHDAYDVTFTATESDIDGALLIGSSRELGDFDQTVNSRAVDDIMRAARRYLPSLLDGSEVLLETRVGLRPFSATGPIVGPVEAVSGLFVAAGHEGSGLTLAPSTADRIVSSLLR